MLLAPERVSLIVRLVFVFTLALLALSAIGFVAAQTPAFTPRHEEPEEFPEAPGREEAFYGCTACHGFKIVAQQGMSRQRWDDTIEFMIQQHKMHTLSAQEREKILDYLARAFSEQPAARRARPNPFLKN
jgi:hypothetical protein